MSSIYLSAVVKENLEKISDINRELMRRLKAKNKKRKTAKQ